MLYKISCQCENKARYCGWNTSAALCTMRSYLRDWHAGPGATTDIRADRIISMKWLAVVVFPVQISLRVTSFRTHLFVFDSSPLSPRCQSSSWLTRKRTWRWTSASTWRPASRRRVSLKITLRLESLWSTICSECFVSENEHKTHTQHKLKKAART